MRLWKTTQEYAQLSEDGELHFSKERNKRSNAFTACSISLCILLLLALSMGVGFQLGEWAGTKQNNDLPNGLKPFGSTPYTYTANTTFVEADKEQSYALLMSYAPSRSGFVRDAVVAPVIGIPGFFHQLHCLYALRESSRAVSEGLTTSRMTDLEHRALCFEYLRNAIVCAADTNIEPFDIERGGVNGWSEHQCRDFESALKWSREHALSEPEIHKFYQGLKIEEQGMD